MNSIFALFTFARVKNLVIYSTKRINFRFSVCIGIYDFFGFLVVDSSMKSKHEEAKDDG
jgi:hypothetical protein